MTLALNFLNFLQGFKSANLSKVKNCQYDTFEPLHEIQKFVLGSYESLNPWKGKLEVASFFAI